MIRDDMTAISVCMATYNGEKYIKEQLDSILAQLPASGEIIISDDSSTDNTLDIVRSFNDIRIKVFPNQKFRNPIFNFENAIKKAQGEYIFLSDQDDVWVTNRIENTINFFFKKKCDVVFSNGYIVDEELNLTGVTLFDHYKPSAGIVSNIITNSYVGCCMAFKADIKELIIPFPKKIPTHDQWIGVISSMFFKVDLLNEPQIYHRRHANNISYTGEKSGYSLVKQLSFRAALISALIERALHFKLSRLNK